MISEFIIEGELVGIHDDSIDLLIDNQIQLNILMRPSMIDIINEAETISPIISVQGRFILDKDKNPKMFVEKFMYRYLEKEQENKEYVR